MKKITNTPNLGRGVAKNKHEPGLKNELSLLNCIKVEGWIREFEAALVTGMSQYTVGIVSRRLAEKGQIFRDKCKNYNTVKTKKQKRNRLENFDGNPGFFLRLTATGASRVNGKSGKDIPIPAAWRHHAVAIQTLHFLATKFKCGFETEACVRHTQQAGKIPDGQLILCNSKYFFEQERSYKKGKDLLTQTKNIAQLAASGTICHVAYPYPAEICGINHEVNHTNSIRHLWGNCDTSLINLVRCHFDSLTAFQNMHASRFEIIDLPQMFNTAASRKKLSNNSNKIIGFNWCMAEQLKNDGSRHINAVLTLGDEIQFEGIFTEGMSEDDNHILEVPAYGNTEIACADLQSFDNFVKYHQTKIVREIEGELKMCAMQIKANEEEDYRINCSYSLP